MEEHYKSERKYLCCSTGVTPVTMRAFLVINTTLGSAGNNTYPSYAWFRSPYSSNNLDAWHGHSAGEVERNFIWYARALRPALNLNF
jgi:hypothetical protein